TNEEFEAALKMYRERLAYELKALHRQKFVPYFTIIHDLYSWARGEDIMVGPGRGSVAGCLIAYLIGLTSVDPIEHGLIFERFINPNRIDMPDIDMDFEDGRRQEVFAYLRRKYGEDKVCQIATIGKLSGKQCLKDVSRVLEVPFAEVNAVTNSIIERSSGDERASQTIHDSFEEFEVCRAFNKRYPAVLEHSDVLEGMAKNLGIHAAGCVASPVPLTDIIPLETRKHDGRDVVVSAGDMYAVAAAGLVKLDVLGLRTLSVLKGAAKAVKERHGVEIDFESSQVDLNDPKVLQGFTDHDYGGVFQYDTPSADKVCSGVSFDSFEDIAAMTALNRPGTSRSGLATRYVDRKKNPEKAKKDDFHPAVTKITSDTLGIIVYQEHVIKIFTDVAGFAPGTADSLRKTIAKKIGDETMGKERANFVRGAAEHTGMDEKTAHKIMDAITFFGSYGFNKSHATAYSMIAFWCMWLKTYYPLEFYWSLLKHEPDRIRIQQFAKHAKKRGIGFLPPSVSISKAEFSIDGERKAIRGSLVDIKGVGAKAAEGIMAAQPYTDFMDFLARVDRRKVHRGVVLALARAGALDDILPNPRWLVENIDPFWKMLTKKGEESQLAVRQMLKDSETAPQWDDEERQLIASKVSPLAFGKHPMDAYGEFVKSNIQTKLAPMSDEGFFKRFNNRIVLVGGIIVEVKLNQIGDFHTGRMPDEDARKRMFWGKRYANVNVEDVGGVQNRIKFDWDIYPDMRPIIELGIGSPVLVMASVNAKFENMKAHFAVDLEGMRRRLRAGEELTIWERIVIGDHPVKHIKAKNKKVAKARWTNAYYRQDRKGGPFWGVVTNVRLKYDKNGQEMAFFGLIGGNGFMIEAVCFHSQWPAVKRVISPGTMLKIQLDRQRDSYRGVSHIFNGGVVKRFKTHSHHKEAKES
ncbi:MAG: DNA polymerase III subunit alpha, partial [bacterium]